MIESFKQIWDIVKGRVITDLNLIGIIVLMWIVSHTNANVLPLVGDLPTAVQPIAKFIVPIIWWGVCQYCIVLSRTQAVLNTSQTYQQEIEHIRSVLAQDYTDIHNSPTAKTIVLDVAKTVIPAAEAVVERELPAAAKPIIEEAVKVAEQAAGLDAVGAASNTAGEAHTPPVIISPVVVEPATATGTNV